MVVGLVSIKEVSLIRSRQKPPLSCFVPAPASAPALAPAPSDVSSSVHPPKQVP